MMNQKVLSSTQIYLVIIGVCLLLVCPPIIVRAQGGSGEKESKLPTPVKKATPAPARRSKPAPRTSRANVARDETAANERTFWESIRDSNDAEDFREYLRSYPNGQFAGLARNRLRTLEASRPDSSVSSSATAVPEALIVPPATLAAQGFTFDDSSAPMCSISGPAGPCQVQAFDGAESSNDTSGHTCSKLDRATYVGQCIGGKLEGVVLIIADGSAKQSRQAYLSYFQNGKIAYPALTSYLNENELDFGVQEKGSSYGCVYFGRWNSSDTRDSCPRFKAFYGSDIFSESNARALRKGTFDLAKYSANFKQFILGR